MATSARRRTEAGGGPGSMARGQRAHVAGGGGAPSLARTPGAVSAAAARWSPSLPAHGGASTGPVPAPSRGPARGLWPRRVGGGEGGPLLPHRVGGAGQPGWRKRSKVTAQGARTPHRHAGPVHGCHTATRAAARHPRAPHALPAPPGPCAQARPLGASCWRLPGPRRSRQNAHPPTRGRTAWAVGSPHRGARCPPAAQGLMGQGPHSAPRQLSTTP